jgi:malonyl-CoA O-methyltransferase
MNAPQVATMATPALIDRRRVKRNFDRAAATYDGASVLQREVAKRLLDRLDLIKRQPTRILDAGSGTGLVTRALERRYPAAGILQLDQSLRMLRASRAAGSFWRQLTRIARAPAPVRICGDMESLPLHSASVDLVCSNLALEWCERPQQAVREFHRVLSRGGLLMFTTLGPDTLKELRAVMAAESGHPGVHHFTDMHDIGDLLVSNGFADPVVDMEHLTLTYADLSALFADLRASGCQYALTSAHRGLRGSDWPARLERRYAAFAQDGRLPATFEIVYGHAWKPEQGSLVRGDGSAVIQFHSRRA